MKPSFRRDTFVFVSLYVLGLLGISALIAVVRNRPPSAYLLERWTDPVWIVVCALGIAIWIRMYPRYRRLARERTDEIG